MVPRPSLRPSALGSPSLGPWSSPRSCPTAVLGSGREDHTPSRGSGRLCWTLPWACRRRLVKLATVTSETDMPPHGCQLSPRWPLALSPVEPVHVHDSPRRHSGRPLWVPDAPRGPWWVPAHRGADARSAAGLTQRLWEPARPVWGLGTAKCCQLKRGLPCPTRCGPAGPASTLAQAESRADRGPRSSTPLGVHGRSTARSSRGARGPEQPRVSSGVTPTLGARGVNALSPPQR